MKYCDLTENSIKNSVIHFQTSNCGNDFVLLFYCQNEGQKSSSTCKNCWGPVLLIQYNVDNQWHWIEQS